MADADLYEQDFYVWAQAQAKALRARSHNQIDWENLAEEVEDLGGSQKRAAMSHARRLIEHLYKLAWGERNETKGGWEREVVSQRLELRANLTPTIRQAVEATLEQLHQEGGDLAERSFRTHEPGTPRDRSLRWTLEQLLGESDDPLPPIGDDQA